MSRRILALDIRHHGVSAVVVKSSLRENRIAGHACVPLEEEADAGANLAEALDTLAATLDFSGCDCVASLPAERFSFRNMEIPFHDRKKIRMVLPFELEPSLPFAVEDIVLDFSMFGRDPASDRTEILAAAFPRKELDRYLEALNNYGLNPETIALGGLPLANWHARRAAAAGELVFLDVDSGSATLFVALDADIRLIRSFPVPAEGGAAFDTLRRQISLTLAAFEERYQRSLQHAEMVIGGHGLAILPMDGNLGRALGTGTVVSDLLAHSEAVTLETGGTDADDWNAHRMDNALALALAEIEGFQSLNIYKSQFPARKFLGKYREQLVKTGWLAAAVMAVLFLGQMITAYTLSQRIGQIDRQTAAVFQSTFPQESRIVDAYKQMQIKLQEARKNAAFNSDSGDHVRGIDVLNTISQRIPADITVDVDRLVIGSDAILISGRTDGFDSVDKIKDGLEEIPYFKKVTISSATMDRSGKEVRFQIKADR